MKLHYPVHLFRQGIALASARFDSARIRRQALALLFTATFCATTVHGDVSTPAGPAVTTIPRQEAAASQAIVVLGDSISAGYGIQRDQGWVQLLDQALARREDAWFAVNASISGETTGGGLARLSGVLQEHAPHIVIIELGGNDGLRGYPISKIRANLNAMVDLVNAADATPIIVAMRIPPNYGPRYTQAFDKVFAEVADAKDAGFVPFLLEDVALAENLMQDDGIHPTAAAQPILLDAVWAYLQPLL